MNIDYLPVVFFIIALCYSSVGFGGGSSYLAIMSLFIPGFYEIRSTALILNISVVSLGTLVFIRKNVFDFSKFWPFLISSIPLAYLGAQAKLSQTSFFLVLGCCLILSGGFMMLRYLKAKLKSRELQFSQKLVLGGSVGLLAGISGIGGGIFLSPTLNLLHWSNPRTVASLASVFILVNSIAGLAGLAAAGTFEVDLQLIWKLILAVLLGGGIGSCLSSSKFNLRVLGGLTAALVVYVGLRLVLLHGFGIKI